MISRVGALTAWIQRSPILRWWLRYWAWMVAFSACWLAADVGFELITGAPWLRQPAGKEASLGMRLFHSLTLPIFSIGLYRLTGLRSISLRDLLVFSGALAITMAFHQDPLVFVSVFLGIAYYTMWVVD
jgi:hypothetical protein